MASIIEKEAQPLQRCDFAGVRGRADRSCVCAASDRRGPFFEAPSLVTRLDSRWNANSER